VVTRQTDADFMRAVENAVQFGQSVMVEGVEEELDQVSWVATELPCPLATRGAAVYAPLGSCPLYL
jgi:hypothetical protein